jgi:threonine/homoserine/homoserine lactone efflux protein
MFGTQDLALFIVSGLLLNLAPGPDSLLIVTRSSSHGWRAGSAAALGIGAGTFVHIFAAALGLSALLIASSTAFTIVKLLGAAYLVYAGFNLLWQSRKRRQLHLADKDDALTSALVAINIQQSYWRLFSQGFLTNVLNPKVAVFFLAFVPQFIAPEAANKALSFIFLGCIFNFNGMLWCHVLAVSSAYASQRLQVNQQLATWCNRLIGGLFISFGLKLALSKNV